MTIHGSKGLEFPVVIMGGLGRKLMDLDSNRPVIISSDYGIGAKCTDLAKRVRTDTFKRKLIRKRQDLDYRGEELRLLYVAMTRAMQKLIMIGAPGRQQYKPDKWEKQAGSGHDVFPPSYIEGAGCILDLVCPVAMRKTEHFAMLSPEQPAEEGAEAAAAEGYDAAAVNEEKESRKQSFLNVADPGQSELKELLDYTYIYGGHEMLPVKLSVSDIKHAEMEEAGKVAAAPWVGGPVSGGAERGTLYHLVMQFIPFDLGEGTDREQAVSDFLDSMEKDAIIDSKQRKMLKPADFARFLETDLAARMAKADMGGHLRREQPFVLGRRACDIDPVKYAGVEDIIPVQGIIDCMFSENGRYVILDYKTDHVDRSNGAEVLIARYMAQLQNYAEAVSRITGIPADEKLIYSFALGSVISL